MKKLILAGAALAFMGTVLVSCGENKETPTETAATTTPETTQPEQTAATTPATGDAPVFSSEEVNKSMAEFKVLRDEYVAAVSSKDQTKIAELNQKFTAWSQNAATASTKLKPAEVQQYTEYMTRLTKEWQSATMNAAK